MITCSNEEANKIVLSECFTYEEAFMSYDAFMKYYMSTRQYKWFSQVREQEAFLVLARAVKGLVHHHYYKDDAVDRSIFKKYSGEDICKELGVIHEHVRLWHSYLRLNAVDREYMDLFVFVLQQWILEIK